MNFKEVIPNIVKGMEINKGDNVVLNFWGENIDLDILDIFALEVLKLGARPIKLQQSKEFLKKYFIEASEAELYDEDYFANLEKANVVIDIFSYGPTPHKDFPKDKLPMYGKYLRRLFSALSKDKRVFVQVRIPTEDNALEEGIDFEVYKEAMIQAMNVDYKKLKEESTRIIEKLSSKKNIEIVTAENILTLSLEEREWNKDDGIGDIPGGEVYIAPVESSANGKVLVPKVNLDGLLLENIVLEFQNGKLIDSTSSEIMDFIKHFPDDSDKIAEFGIGLNENVKELIGYSLIDEKCKGTVHIAIGMNNLFGGVNESQLHFDFVFTPTLVKFDNEILIEGNKSYI